MLGIGYYPLDSQYPIDFNLYSYFCQLNKIIYCIGKLNKNAKIYVSQKILAHEICISYKKNIIRKLIST